nr:reverse transcriptase [Tanacetum cinerariifolium]
MVIRKLKEKIKSLIGNVNEDKVKNDLDEIEMIKIELDHRVNIVVNSSVNNASMNVHEYKKCLKLEIELLNKKDFIEKETYDKLFRRYTTLKKHYISLKVDTQINQEIFQRDYSVSNQRAPNFDHYFALNELKVQSQEKDTVIRKLKEKIKSLIGNVNEDKVKNDLDEIEMIKIELDHRVSKLIAENEHLKQTYKQLYDSIKPIRVRSKEQCVALITQVNQKSVEISDLNANLQEKGLIKVALNDELKKLKGKAFVHNAITTHTIALETLKINVEPLAHGLLNNKTTHSDYLRLTQEQAAILKEVVEQGKSQNLLNNSLDSSCEFVTDDKVVADEDDDVFVEATPIGTKVLVVNYEAVMIKNKPREDLKDLWKIMKAKFSTSKPTDFTDDYLLVTLKNMFEKTDAQDVIWRSQQIEHGQALVKKLKLFRDAAAAAHMKRIIKTIHVDFDKLTVMASEHNSLESVLHEITSAIISLGLVPNPPPSTSFIPPTRTNWDLLFQPLFDELLTPPPNVDLLALEVIALIAEVVAPEPTALTSSPSSKTVDQEAPSPKNVCEASSSSDVISIVVHTAAPNSEHVKKYTKDHPLDNIIDELRRPVSIRLQLYEQALFCYYDVQPDEFVDKDNLNHVYKLKKALYGLKKVPRAWYDWRTYLGFRRDYCTIKDYGWEFSFEVDGTVLLILIVFDIPERSSLQIKRSTMSLSFLFFESDVFLYGKMSYLTDYEEIDEGYVAFGGNPKEGKITRKVEGSAMPTDPRHTHIILQPSSFQPQKTHKPRKPKRKDTQVPQLSGHTESVVDVVVYKELDDSLVRAATTASSLEAEQKNDDTEMFDVNDLHGEEVFVEKEAANKEVSTAGEVNAASITTTVSAAAKITTKEITFAQELVEIKTSKPKAK